MNSFHQTWSNESNWLVPPPSCILECINKLKADKCSGTLIVPKWESASVWPLLVDNFGNFVTFIKGVYV